MAYPNQAQTFEGKLSKVGKYNKTWKERWFILDEYKQKLEYYPSQKDVINDPNLCKEIDLSIIKRIETTSNIDKIRETELLKRHNAIFCKFILFDNKFKSSKPHSFLLITNDRKFLLSAPNTKSFSQWLIKLSRIIYGNIVQEGQLKKLHFPQTWKQRYFTLNKYKYIKFYIDKTRQEFLGVIDLNNHSYTLIDNTKSYGNMFSKSRLVFNNW
eukprot:417724_1